jgi:holin-like protein
MPSAFAILVGLQLVGEVLRQTLHLPLPGPLIGMVLLTVVLVFRGSAGALAERAIPSSLLKAANGLITNMGLLFVPVGVGIIAEVPCCGTSGWQLWWDCWSRRCLGSRSPGW